MKLVVWALVFLQLVLSGLTGYQLLVGREAHDGMCALRQDLEVRVANSERYLRDVKAGRRDPIVGITEQDIKTGIDNQKRTIEALSNLGCPPITLPLGGPA